MGCWGLYPEQCDSVYDNYGNILFTLGYDDSMEEPIVFSKEQIKIINDELISMYDSSYYFVGLVRLFDQKGVAISNRVWTLALNAIEEFIRDEDWSEWEDGKEAVALEVKGNILLKKILVFNLL
jgi:hypothetical protein